jgi:hypothetical protein
MELLQYKVDQAEKRADALERRLTGIESSLSEIKTMLSAVASKHTIGGWGLGLLAAIIGTGITAGTILLQATGNQLAAFQAGLAPVQSVVAANPPVSPSAQPMLKPGK